ncbi:hypothetical protein E4U58_007159 [Claviceps cyperi]|nr:hypothetical protein E4U58_007159 [Claviceps cyperi]
MGSDVVKYISGCLPCAQHNPGKRKAPRQPVTVDEPLQVVGMDHALFGTEGFYTDPGPSSLYHSGVVVVLEEEGSWDDECAATVTQGRCGYFQDVLNKTTENQTDRDLHLPSVAKVLNSRYVKSVGFSPVEVLYGLSRASNVGLGVFLTQASRGWDNHFCRSLAWPLEMSLEGDSRVHWMGRVEGRRSKVQYRGQLEAVGPFRSGRYGDDSGRGKATKAAVALVWPFSRQTPGWSRIVSACQS